MRLRTHARRLARIVALILVTALAPAGTAQQRGAQAPTQRPSDPNRPNWLQRKISDIGWRPMPAAYRPVFLARWTEYDRLFAAPESMARPNGFTVAPAALAYGEGDPSRLFNFYVRYIFLTGTVTSGEGAALLGIWENPVARNIWTVDSGPATFKDAQGEMYLERPRGTSMPVLPPGAVVFDGPLQFNSKNSANENVIFVLLTATGDVPWSDVPRERVLKSLIADAQKTLDDVEKLYSDPNYRKAVESTGGRGAVERNLAAVRDPVTRLRSELAALSPAERAAPAWVQLTRSGTIEFAAPGTPGFQHVIADKPGYYRAAGSRTALRAMLIRFGLTNGFNVAMDRAIEDSYKAFDWTAAARLLTK